MKLFINAPKILEFHMVSPNHKAENSLLKEDRLKSVKPVIYAQSIEWLKKKLPLYPDFYNSC